MPAAKKQPTAAQKRAATKKAEEAKAKKELLESLTAEEQRLSSDLGNRTLSVQEQMGAYRIARQRMLEEEYYSQESDGLVRATIDGQIRWQAELARDGITEIESIRQQLLNIRKQINDLT